MIINPIMPIWLMSVISILLIVLIIFYKKNRVNNSVRFNKNRIISIFIKIIIVIFLFIINLRFMIPNGEGIELNSDLNVLFVIDTSFSMGALDYKGNKERMEGVINDCCYIVDELAGSEFSIITFGNDVKKNIPFTFDSDMVQIELKSLKIEDNRYAKGTSLNSTKDILEKTLKEESKRKKQEGKFIVFFISDGEITKKGDELKSFASLENYVLNGAVLGYGTTDGGKMVDSSFKDDPNSQFYYIDYYDEEFNRSIALSKLDENNLKRISNDLGIDYINMSNQNNIKYKINQIKSLASNSQLLNKKKKNYNDLYYYFSIPLVLLFIINFIIQKRSF